MVSLLQKGDTTMKRPYIEMPKEELLREIWDTHENVKYAVARLETVPTRPSGSFVGYIRHSEYLRYAKYLKQLECEYMYRTED